MDGGDVIVRSAIAGSTIAYAWGEWLQSSRAHRWSGRARIVWTTGAALCVAHVAAAFHVRYGWSHAHAYRDTALQTAAVTGLEWGGGLWVNYAFLAVWAADVGWWWIWPESRATRPRWLHAGIGFFFLFMFLNGAVVFAGGPARLIGIAAVGVAAVALWKRADRGQASV